MKSEVWKVLRKKIFLYFGPEVVSEPLLFEDSCRASRTIEETFPQGSPILDSPMVTLQAVVSMVYGACCQGNRLGWHGNIGPSVSHDQDGGHVTRDPRDRPWWLALVAQKPYISKLLEGNRMIFRNLQIFQSSRWFFEIFLTSPDRTWPALALNF